jgi:hypothetical protein
MSRMPHSKRNKVTMNVCPVWHSPRAQDATTDEAQIAEWSTAMRYANIGIPTDGLCVVDIDGAE